MAKQKKLNTIFIIYWVLLAYIIAALVWWFVALNKQNKQIATILVLEKLSIVFKYRIILVTGII
mgnify:CR=1 FL=1